LHAVVHDGAGVSFIVPFSVEDARRFWRDRVVPGVRAQTRRVLVARRDGRIVGTVQLDLGTPPNQLHRAEVSKLLVHPEARRRGIARALMVALEAVARSEGRTLLTLDTWTGREAEALYRSLGYTVAGVIPRYARGSVTPDLEPTTIMYKELAEAREPRSGEPQPPGGVLDLLPARRGHFRLESGHHGELWLDVERLFLRPVAVRPWAERLADALTAHEVEVVCGPLSEGAFVGLTVASRLNVAFTYSEKRDDRPGTGLFPARYRLPRALRNEVRGRRVALVNDIINAGSAVRGTLEDLRACGARPVAIGALAVLGARAGLLAADAGIPLETLATLPNEIWLPSECPLCRAHIPLADHAET
jgi:orotate phosphoribosyltransferase/ribosomal protein S18 acetylase RimI-like enzyme